MNYNEHLVIRIIGHGKTQSNQWLEPTQACLSEPIDKRFGYTPLRDHSDHSEMDGARNPQTIHNSPRNFDDCPSFHKTFYILQW